MEKYIRIGFIIGILMASTMVSMMGAANHQTKPTNVLGGASWAADLNGDHTMEARGWISYTHDKGVAGRKIKITGTWETDDGNLSGSLTIKNFVVIKFRGVYKGLFTGAVSGDYYTAKFIGFFYNDWEVG